MKHTLATLLLLGTAALAQNSADRAISATQNVNVRFRTSDRLAQRLPDLNTTQAPELFPGELQDVGPQFLLGRAQAAAPKRHWLEAFADTQFFYTNNALLTEKGNRDTGAMVLTLQATLSPEPFALGEAMVSPRFGYRHQWWLYSLDKTRSGLNNFNFSVSSFFAGVRHSWDEKWIASLSFDYNRYLSQDEDQEEFYTEFVPSWSLERNIQLREKSLLTIGYYGALHMTHTAPTPTSDINDRLDTILSVAYTQELLPGLAVQPYYRIQWANYGKNTDRNDLYNNLGVALIYSINEWATIRGTIAYENRNSSDNQVADYNKLEVGGGVNLSVRF